MQNVKNVPNVEKTGVSGENHRPVASDDFITKCYTSQNISFFHSEPK